MTEPEQLSPDPAVARWAYRWRSSRDQRVTYDVALLIGEEGDYIDCTCPGFTYRDQCKHVALTVLHRRVLLRRAVRQAWLDERRGCRHPLTVDEEEPDYVEQRTRVTRACVGCGTSYDRTAILDQIEADIRARHRLPSSPWSADERSSDTE